MHDELREAGLRRLRVWTAVLVVVGAVGGMLFVFVAFFEPVWPAELGLVDGGLATLAAGAAGGAIGSLVLLATGTRAAARRAWPTVPLEPAPHLVPLVEGVAIARGEPVPRVWRLVSNAPNVACLPRPNGRHVIVSTAAESGLTRNELEAIIALQFSLLLDEGATRVRRTLVAAGRMISWAIRLILIALVVTLAREIVWAGLTINLAIWLGIGGIALIVFVQRRVRWSWGIVGDAVAIQTTRYPEPLVHALRRLAGHNEEQVPVKRTYGAADPYWVVPVRARTSMQIMVTNGRAQQERSTEQVSDAALLLRAGVVQRMCLGGDPATLAAWEEAEQTFLRLSHYGGTGAGDGTIDGVLVTPDGATYGTAGPVGAVIPPSPGLVAGPQGRRRRPWHPDRQALVAYDALVGHPTGPV